GQAWFSAGMTTTRRWGWGGGKSGGSVGVVGDVGLGLGGDARSVPVGRAGLRAGRRVGLLVRGHAGRALRCRGGAQYATQQAGHALDRLAEGVGDTADEAADRVARLRLALWRLLRLGLLRRGGRLRGLRRRLRGAGVPVRLGAG